VFLKLPSALATAKMTVVIIHVMGHAEHNEQTRVDYLTDLRKGDIVQYKLDIMVVDEKYLYRTWLNLSRYKTSQLVDQVWVDLRAIGEFDPFQCARSGRSGWYDANAVGNTGLSPVA
jgi:hypothetical protein